MLLKDALKRTRRAAGKTQKEVAILLGMAERSYQHYELGERIPGIDTLTHLADAYNVSLDYLTGRSDDPARL